MKADGRFRRFRESILSVGEFAGETVDQRGRRRIIVGILWLSAVGLSLGALSGEGPWVSAMDALKAASHMGALAALRFFPRRIAPILHVALGLDLFADVTSSVLLGGLYESGLQVMWSLLAPLMILILLTVRVALVWFGLFIGAVIFVAGSSSWADPTYEVADPQADGMFAIIGVTVFVVLALSYFVRQRDRFQRESDDLLHNILPDEIATRLKGDGGMIADLFEEVSVLFLDVVDFTPISASMAPTELVGLLNEIFTGFDGFVDELGLEKIKTVGDEYMVAAGVPTPRSDHAHVIADLALRMQDHLATHEFAGYQIMARIGINSGPVVAGIIGRRKFSYDLWGDVVNTASRMESHGQPGAIQISAATYERIKDDFECERRGAIEVKGKGKLDAWFVHGRLTGAPLAGR
jgi:guanylate cyclase